MNLKETIISSFFYHLILFLLMVAVSSRTTGLSSGFQNIVSVDLAIDDKDRPGVALNPSDNPPLSSEEEVSLPDEAVTIQPEDSMEKPESERNVETITESAKIGNAEKMPAQTGEFTSLEAYHQFILLHKKVFGQKAGSKVNELLGEALKSNTRQFYGGTAVVSLTFGLDGTLSEVLVTSESPDLKAFLEEIGWGALPTPAQYPLKFTGVQITFTVLQGYMSFKIDAL
jgi:hypothetical protein